MNPNYLALLCLSAFCPPAQSQLLLNAGDTYIYEFASLGTPNVVSGFNPTGNLFTPVFSAYIRPIDWITIEAFEDNTSETPWCSHSYASPDPLLDHCGDSVRWSDHQGVVRITVLAGSVTLDSMSFYRQEPTGFGNTAIYSMTVTPVPEPAALSMLGVAGLGGLVWHLRKKAWRRI